MSHVIGEPALRLEVQPDRGRVVVEVSGEIDLATVGELDEMVGELQGNGWRELVLDLRPVTFIDSIGLSWLLRVERAARREDATLSLVDGSSAVARLLDATGLRDHFRWARGL